ncbi:MAG TPA: hypothetical protein VGL92_08825 [Acidimicrobiia bacterium]|jgi:uncharacterized delta-60 repeat protein
MPSSLRFFLVATLALFVAPAPAGAAGGDLDSGFGDAGKVVVTPPPDAGEIASAHAVLPDGSVVVAGTAAPARSGYAFLVLRVLPDGRLDPGFGSGGRVWTDLVTVGWPLLDGAVAGGVASLGSSAAYAVAVQPDGRIVVAGTTSSGASAAYALVRYLPDGQLDDGFGSGGLVVTDFDGTTDDVASALVLLPDGRIVAAGRAGDRFALARYLPDGQLDPSFGTAGLVTTRQGLIAGLAAGLDPAGRIVLAGQGGAPGGPYDLAVARYLPDGKLDPTFGDRGVVRKDLGPSGEWASSLALPPDGGVVLAGTSGSTFALLRYRADGRPDPAFGNAGVVTAGPAIGSARAVIADPAGRLVVAGERLVVDSQRQVAVARYAPSGTLDTAFAPDGIVGTDVLPGRHDGSWAASLLPSGDLVVTGTSLDQNNSYPLVFLLRYIPTP